MSKWAEVVVTCWKVFAVEIEDDETLEDAEQYALEEAMDCDNIEVKESNLTEDRFVGSLIKHADEVLKLN